LRYEDLRDHFEESLEKIKQQFDLIQRNDQYVKIPKYKGTFLADYYKKPILLKEEIQEEIKQRVDKEQENQLGYLL
jgi:hypothetical protein